ncbi:MAG TPA: TraR/DksA C4-type zinc finger protein [Candidatus Elarobacter sp.]|jgi:hypothetical protein|nr:TraR/DksA C4-type zinc finger protein [Candidatus Elarobacter sp.]
MDTLLLCPDCGDEHDQAAEAALGHRIRCLDCQIEIDLALEISTVVLVPLAA